MTNVANFLNTIAAETGSTDKSAVINTAIAMLIKSGVDVREAVDMICGEGTFTKLAGDIWDAARAA